MKLFSSILVFLGVFVAIATVETSFILAFIGMCISGVGAFISHLIDKYENPNHYPPKY